MPTISKPKKVVTIGNSKYIHVGSDYYRAIQQKTKKSKPKFRIIGDTVLVVKPEGVELDPDQLAELLKQVTEPIVDNVENTNDIQSEKEK